MKVDLAAWLCKGLPGIGKRFPQLCENVLEPAQKAMTSERVGVVHLVVKRVKLGCFAMSTRKQISLLSLRNRQLT